MTRRLIVRCVLLLAALAGCATAAEQPDRFHQLDGDGFEASGADVDRADGESYLGLVGADGRPIEYAGWMRIDRAVNGRFRTTRMIGYELRGETNGAFVHVLGRGDVDPIVDVFVSNGRNWSFVKRIDSSSRANEHLRLELGALRTFVVVYDRYMRDGRFVFSVRSTETAELGDRIPELASLADSSSPACVAHADCIEGYVCDESNGNAALCWKRNVPRPPANQGSGEQSFCGESSVGCEPIVETE